jgi:uncharacterized protein YegP (UPF0339 family)
MKAVIKKVNKGKSKGQFRFVLIAENGEPIAQSWTESYTTKQMIKKTLARLFPEFEIIDKS